MRIAFAGTPEFSKYILEQLIAVDHNIVTVYTQPDKPRGRGKKLLPTPVKELALQHDLTILQPASLKNSTAAQQLQELDIDVMIVVAYGLILPENILNIPKYGCINIHASMLPRWRGAAPIQRAILAGDSKTGITIMQMDAGLDTGNMLLTQECTIDDTDTSYALELKLRIISAELIIKFLNNVTGYLDGAIQQDDSVSCYAAKITKLEAKLDWNESAIHLSRKIRAFNPVPGCYCFLSDNVTRIKIWQTIVVTEKQHNVTPGTIVQANNTGIDVVTGDKTILRILRLQLPGSKPMQVKDVLNSKAKLLKIHSSLL